MIGVVVLNYNGTTETLNCVRSLSSLEDDFQLIVVENGSHDGSFDRLHEEFKNHFSVSVIEYEESSPDRPTSALGRRSVVLVRIIKNRGYAGGCNAGARVALELGCSGVLFLTNDTWLQADTLAPLKAVIQAQPAALIGIVTLDPATGAVSFSGSRWPHVLYGAGRQLDLPESMVRDTGYVEGSAFYLPSDLADKMIKKHGSVFDESLFLYCEDVDLSLRARELGYSCCMSKALKIYHTGSLSGGGAGNKFAHYYITRNRLHLARRWLGAGHRSFYFLYYVISRMILQALLWRLRSRDVRQAVWQGLWDGLSGLKGEWRPRNSPRLDALGKPRET